MRKSLVLIVAALVMPSATARTQDRKTFDIWQLHFSVERPANPRSEETGQPGGKDLNAPEAFIANLGDAPLTHAPVNALKISVRSDGSFTVTNTRHGYSTEYTPGSKR